jgi:uncharacterized membrane protein YraQ (UPF0718 family)
VKTVPAISGRITITPHDTGMQNRYRSSYNTVIQGVLVNVCELVIAPLALNFYKKCMSMITMPIFLTIMLYEVYIYYFLCVRWDS